VELTLALNLALKAVEQVTFKLGNFSAAQACHVDVITLRAPLIEVFLSLHMHQVELIDKTVSLQQLESAINRDAVDTGINLARMPQNLGCVQMLLGGFHDAQNCPSLVSKTKTARGQRGLQMTRCFGLG
jgi:hypothetical protein